LDQIHSVLTEAQAIDAAQVLERAPVWGFDTESKPRFKTDDPANGPHVVQLALPDRAYVFQLQDPACGVVVARLLARTNIVKAGFGLRDDRKLVMSKLGVEIADMLDLNQVFAARGYRKEIGVKDAVAATLQRAFTKSKRLSVSNWANLSLTDSQLLYAANDAYAALRVYECCQSAAVN
jgi:ribonuclease D